MMYAKDNHQTNSYLVEKNFISIQQINNIFYNSKKKMYKKHKNSYHFL